MSGIKISTILDLIKNKNQTGFDLLYEHHYKLMFTTAFSVTQNEEDSQDIVQNVAHKLAIMPVKNFPEKGEVSWLYRVVKNEAINYAKSRKQYDNLDEKVQAPLFDKDLSEVFDMENYYTLIEGLNENQKQVVTLKVLGELSHKEIAQLLDKPIGTVQWIYNTSIMKLRISLAAMSAVAFAFFIGASSRVYRIFKDITTLPNEQMPEQSPPIEELPQYGGVPPTGGFSPIEETDISYELINDTIFIVCVIGLFLLLFGIYLFMKFSERLPIRNKNR